MEQGVDELGAWGSRPSGPYSRFSWININFVSEQQISLSYTAMSV